jgi:GT2 family glycosyltransferase
VITIVAGRHQHLANQQRGIARGSQLPTDHVVVAIADPDVNNAVAGRWPSPHLINIDTTATGLPLARARNAGAAAALARGADLLVFLDVDCIPGFRLLQRYREAAERPGRYLLCGPVAYLPPQPPGGYPDQLDYLAEPHPGRPAPADGQTIDTEDHRLFWSLSFAVAAPTWRALGGFCENYTGYGGEDTDFGQLACTAAAGIRWVGGATAYHQHHRVSNPPVEHLDDILRNASTFYRRWGWWPMTGWLTEFERRGLVRFARERNRWIRCGSRPRKREIVEHTRGADGSVPE